MELTGRFPNSSYVPSWPRLVQACNLIDAIWRDDLKNVRDLVIKHPRLLHEMARGTEKCNWGPPMSYAANLGRDEIIRVLHDLVATDLESAIDRATLQSKVSTARMLHEMMGQPLPPAWMDCRSWWPRVKFDFLDSLPCWGKVKEL